MKKSKKNEEMAIKKEELKKEEKIHKAEIAKKSFRLDGEPIAGFQNMESMELLAARWQM